MTTRCLGSLLVFVFIELYACIQLMWNILRANRLKYSLQVKRMGSVSWGRFWCTVKRGVNLTLTERAVQHIVNGMIVIAMLFLFLGMPAQYVPESHMVHQVPSCYWCSSQRKTEISVSFKGIRIVKIILNQWVDECQNGTLVERYWQGKTKLLKEKPTPSATLPLWQELWLSDSCYNSRTVRYGPCEV